MRQVLRAFSALALSLVLVSSGFAAEAYKRPISEELALAESAFQKRQVKKGLDELQRAADRGSIRATLRIAEIFDEGELISRDLLKACYTYSSWA